MDEASRRAVARLQGRRLLRDAAVAVVAVIAGWLIIAGGGAVWQHLTTARSSSPPWVPPRSFAQSLASYMKAARAVPLPDTSNTLVKLQIAYLYRDSAQWESAERICREVLRETRDPEEVSVVRHLVVELDQAREVWRQATAATAPVPLPPPPVPLAPRVAPAPRPPLPAARPAEPVPSLPPPPSAATPDLMAGASIVGWFESALPIAVRMFADQVSAYLVLAGEQAYTRQITQRDLELQLLQRVRARLARQVQRVTATIRPDGIVGSATVSLGQMTFPVAARVGVAAVDDRPHVLLHEVTIGAMRVPGPLLRLLESRVNQVIDRERLPVKITRIEFGDGYAMITAERA